MARIIESACFIGLLLLASSFDVFSQTNLNDLKLTVSVDKTTFVPHQKVRVKIRIENNSGQTISTRLAIVSINLSKNRQGFRDCRSSECFGAYPNWNKKFKDNKTYQETVDLTNLYWNDSISSAFDFSSPKNFFKAVPAGNYYLFLTFQFRDEKNSTKEDPRSITISSNEILITVEDKRFKE